MVHSRKISAVSVLLAVMATACSPLTSGRGSTVASRGQALPSAPQVLRIATQREPSLLNLDFAPSLSSSDIPPIVHDTLVVQDERGSWVPQLAMEQISFERGTWRVNADGTMRTIWRIHPDVRWHDGTPFTAADLVFSSSVYRDPAIPNRARGGAPALISATSAPDATTFVVDWSAAYARADRAEGLVPLPRHLLADVYENDRASLAESSFLRDGFVGLGPYRLQKWDVGVQIELARNPDYYRGRPGFDLVVVQFVPDVPARVAQILAGAVDVLPSGIDLDSALAVRERWKGTRNQVMTAVTDSMLRIEVQHRPELAQPARALTVAAVRQALYQAIDRPTLIESLTQGVAPLADSWFPPTHALRPAVEVAIPQYPYDVARARRLLAGAGWVLASDGTLVNEATRERLDVELRAPPGGDQQRAQVAIGSFWGAVGVAVSPNGLTPALWADFEYRAKMPGAVVYLTQGERYYGLEQHSRNVASPANNWRGPNREGYANPRVDSLLDRIAVTVPLPERLELHRELLREQLGDVAVMPLYWSVEPLLALGTVKGVTGRGTWNIFEWAPAGQ